MKFACFFIVAAAAMASLVTAVPFTNSPNPNSYIEINTDGSKTPPIRLLGRGEVGGYDATVEVTEDGYTVSKKNGMYVYMEFDSASGTMVSSGLQAGTNNPAISKSKRTGKKLDKHEHKKEPNRNAGNVAAHLRRLIANIEENNGIPNEHSHVNHRETTVLGNKVNLMIPFKFSNHASRVVPSIADLTVLMNNVGPNSALCPSGSVRDVYLASSYNQLVLDTTVAPWVTIPNNETYYAAGNSGLGSMAHIMIQDALNALQATGFNFGPFDTDNDGYIDAIGFLHSGYGAEWGGTDAYGTAYANRIWSHKWAVYTLPGGKWTSSSGKSVYNYHISPSVWGTSGSSIGRIGVIAHETGHFFGLPDLYDGSVGSGIGSFCLMANSWGFDGTQLYPPHMSAWSKIQLGWVTPTVITTSGTYTARQGCLYPDVFQVSTNFPSGEYLLIENRQKCNFDAKISGPGLAIFHIDGSASFTTEGYPGQTGWPTNAQHYRVALLQADGNYNLEKGNNRGDATDLFFSGGVNGITTSGTTGGLAYPNTKAYKGGIILETGINITQISASSVNMTFVVNFGPLPPKPVTSKPITAKPITSNPVTAQPTTSKPAKPVTSNPVTSKPITAKPITSNPVTAQPTTSKPAKPVTSIPVTSKPITAKPITSNPVTAQPTTSKPVTANPTTKKPTTRKPTTKKPAAPVPKPVAPVPKPVAPVPKPVAPVPKPVAPVPKPVAPVPKPAAPVPKPAAPVPKPAAPAPKPAAPVAKPACVASGRSCATSSACCSNVCQTNRKCK